MNINTELKNGWGLNFKSEFRSVFKQGLKGLEPEIKNKYIHTDLSVLSTKKVGLGNTLAFGFLLRFREDKIVQRYIQQYILVRNYDGYRMSYRFALDQTRDDTNEIRIRYRTASEIPLNGKKVDPKEFYLKLNHELLYKFESGNFDLENRLVPLLGYKFKDTNKIELGLDYRIEDFIKNKPRHTAWVSVNWYIKI